MLAYIWNFKSLTGVKQNMVRAKIGQEKTGFSEKLVFICMSFPVFKIF